MTLCDLLFPLNLPHLTYRVPEHLKGAIRTGYTVEAPLKNRIRPALVVRIYEGQGEGLKEVSSLRDDLPPLPGSLLQLMRWASGYYRSKEGLILRAMHFPEFTLQTKREPKERHLIDIPLWEEPQGSPSILNEIMTLTREGRYRAFLLKTDDHIIQRGIILKIVKEVQAGHGILILSSEVEEADRIYALLRSCIGEGVCILHGEMTRAQRSRTLRHLASGMCKVLVGTRSAVFAPLPRLSLIVVSDEHSPSYKAEGAPGYHSRDVSIMRAYLERCPVVLLTPCPSTDAYYGVLKGKITFYEFRQRQRRYSVEVKRVLPSKGPLTAGTLQEISRALQMGKQVMVVHHRVGYSMLRCQECEHLFSCTYCSKPLVLHRGEALVCHLCGSREEIPLVCSRCGGIRLTEYGAGLELLRDKLRQKLGVNPRGLEEVTRGEAVGLVLSTLRRKTHGERKFDMIVLLNPDLFINLPEYRATERLMQGICYLKELLAEGGRMILLSSMPWHEVFRYVRRWDYMGFLLNELNLRKKLSLPPYEKAVTFDLHFKEPVKEEFMHSLKGLLKGAKVVGPVLTGSYLKTYRYLVRITILGREKALQLEDSIKAVAGKAVLRIDVDPLGF